MIAYHKTKYGVLYDGKSDNVLRCLDPESVDCCITSPPYWGLRDYGTASWVGGDANCNHWRDSKVSGKGETGSDNVVNGIGDAIYKDVCGKCGAVRVDDQIGLEPTPEEYVDNLVKVFREVKRVLKKDGVLWLNLGDSYAGSGVHAAHHANQGISQSAKRGCTNGVPVSTGLKPKDLVGIPWMVAFALRADGWYLRQDIIWQKPNPMPESVKDRCTKSHEYIFLLSKSPNYYYDYKAIREIANGYDGRKQTIMLGSKKYSQKISPRMEVQSFANHGHERWSFDNVIVDGVPQMLPVKNKRSVWIVPVSRNAFAHFATFPKKLIEPMIKTTRTDAVILDPFVGSGTTAIVAIENGRSYVGIDLNKGYLDIASSQIDSLIDQTEIALDGMS